MNIITSTICAISTPNGVGGICVLRISGDKAVEIAASVVEEFDNPSKNYIENLKPQFFARGHAKNSNGEVIDDVMVVKFNAPKSFTGEDLVEIHCHGGTAVSQAILKELYKNGAEPAEAGEFTHRAFLNGKINLTVAESIGNIIHAKTENAVLNAAQGLTGTLSEEILDIRDNLKEIAAGILVSMDYEDIESNEFADKLNIAYQKVLELSQSASRGIIQQEGLNVAIMGSPNVGKSSLLNALLKDDRAIVTDVAGTTRDIIREQANISGCLVNFLDTAGIRETSDKVEKIGIEKAKEQINKADLVIVVLDSTRELNSDDEHILDLTKSVKRIIIKNKADVGKGTVSTKTGYGMDNLCKEIADFATDGVKGRPKITTERQKKQVTSCEQSLKMAVALLREDGKQDLILGEIENAIKALGEMLGESVNDEIVAEIFSKFCVGK